MSYSYFWWEEADGFFNVIAITINVIILTLGENIQRILFFLAAVL